MEIEDKYLSIENISENDIITFVDSGTKSQIKSQQTGQMRSVINFMVNNGRYNLLYTPSSTAIKQLIKMFGRETEKWIGMKFKVRLIDSLSFGKPVKLIFPAPIEEKV